MQSVSNMYSPLMQPLEKLLQHPVFQRAQPEVLAYPREGFAQRKVRWVHSSEIREIAPLLRGDELLLTTGLGLADTDAAQRRDYIYQLADRGVAALGFEIGRTFASMPRDMIEAAQKRGFPLIALHTFVPFVEISEALNALMVEASVERLERAEQVSRDLTRILLSGQGLDQLVQALAQHAGGSAELVAADGAVLAHCGVSPPIPPPVLSIPVVVHDSLWGTFRMQYPENETMAEAIRERAGTFLALALVRSGTEVELLSGRRSLLEELVAGSGEVVGLPYRLNELGIKSSDQSLHAGVVMRQDKAGTVPDLNHVKDEGWRVLSVDMGRTHVGLLTHPAIPGQSPWELEQELRHALERDIAASSRKSGRRIVYGALGGPTSAGRSIRSAMQALQVCDSVPHLPALPQVVSAAELTLEVALSSVDSEVLRELAQPLAPLGVLPEATARNGGQPSVLLETLWALRMGGGNKSTLARDLGIRRQSVYQRLVRLEQILGFPLDAPEQQPVIQTALAAARVFALRTYV